MSITVKPFLPYTLLTNTNTNTNVLISLHEKYVQVSYWLSACGEWHIGQKRDVLTPIYSSINKWSRAQVIKKHLRWITFRCTLEIFRSNKKKNISNIRVRLGGGGGQEGGRTRALHALVVGPLNYASSREGDALVLSERFAIDNDQYIFSGHVNSLIPYVRLFLILSLIAV